MRHATKWDVSELGNPLPSSAIYPVRHARHPARNPARSIARLLRRTCAALAFALALGTLSPPAYAEDAGPFALSELRLGILRHDAGIFSHSVEGGWDVNGEALFVSPSFLAAIWSPRPHLGTSVDLEGKTSQIYAGLTWDFALTERFFLEASAGGALHNGKLDKADPHRKDLGSHLEFRESGSLGYRLTEHANLLLTLDHISNAGLATYNGGMENVGLRYGYRF